MTTPLNYPYSDVYLREHMSRISRGVVLLVLFIISSIIAVAGAYGLATAVAKLFN